MLEHIGSQAYRLALSEKYTYLHPVFSVQLLEEYCCYHNNAKLMMMSDFKDFQEE